MKTFLDFPIIGWVIVLFLCIPVAFAINAFTSGLANSSAPATASVKEQPKPQTVDCTPKALGGFICTITNQITN